MRVHVLRKILIVLIIFTPVISYSGCRKQAKCGCDGDVLFSLTSEPAYVYNNESGSPNYFVTLADPYSQYQFCNPSETLKMFSDYKSGDVLQVSGNALWECNYLSQSSNSTYQTGYKVYVIQVTAFSVNLYGKK
jgi:hypothetical protein